MCSRLTLAKTFSCQWRAMGKVTSEVSLALSLMHVALGSTFLPQSLGTVPCMALRCRVSLTQFIAGLWASLAFLILSVFIPFQPLSTPSPSPLSI